MSCCQKTIPFGDKKHQNLAILKFSRADAYHFFPVYMIEQTFTVYNFVLSQVSTQNQSVILKSIMSCK